MLGALSLKWKWRQRREAAGKDTDKPNLIFGGDVHVVWEKFCRYFDVEPRIVPLQPDKYTIGPGDVEPHIDENTIGVAAVLGTTFTGHKDDIEGINDLLVGLKNDKGLDVPLHIDGASGAFTWPFLYPDSKWDFRLEQVRSINASRAQVRARLPGDRVADLPVRRRTWPRTSSFTRTTSARPTRPSRSTSRPGPRWSWPSTTTSSASATALPLCDGGDAVERQAARRRDREDRAVQGDRSRRGAVAPGRLQPGRSRQRAVRRVRRRLAGRSRTRLDAARLHDAAASGECEDAPRPGQAQPQPRPWSRPSPTTSMPPARRSRRRVAPAKRSASG